MNTNGSTEVPKGRLSTQMTTGCKSTHKYTHNNLVCGLKEQHILETKKRTGKRNIFVVHSLTSDLWGMSF